MALIQNESRGAGAARRWKEQGLGDLTAHTRMGVPKQFRAAAARLLNRLVGTLSRTRTPPSPPAQRLPGSGGRR